MGLNRKGLSVGRLWGNERKGTRKNVTEDVKFNIYYASLIVTIF